MKSKRLLAILGLVGLLSSCEIQPASNFKFHTSNSYLSEFGSAGNVFGIAGDTITCINTSKDASSYVWTLLDGYQVFMKDLVYVIPDNFKTFASYDGMSYCLKISLEVFSKRKRKSDQIHYYIFN